MSGTEYTSKERHHVAALDRRARFLEGRGEASSEHAALSWDLAEAAAIRWALATLDAARQPAPDDAAALAAALTKEVTRALNLLHIEGNQSNESYGRYIADYLTGGAIDPNLWVYLPLAALPVHPPAPLPDDAAALAAARDGAYRERNAVVAALIRSNGWPAEVVMAPDSEGWWIVYAETPQGQVSWHIAPDDMDLFRDWPVAFGTQRSPWDGHTTEEKYRRLAALPVHPPAPLPLDVEPDEDTQEAMYRALLYVLQEVPRPLTPLLVIRALRQDGYVVARLATPEPTEGERP